MQRRVGSVSIETVAAESPKFTAPMLLVHGLWCTAAVWRKFMGYLAHRGWTCHAVNLRGRGAADTGARLGEVKLRDYLDDLRQVIAACDAAPVLLGHDLGGLLVLHQDVPAPRAAVALAPLVPRTLATTPNRALTHWATRLAMLRACPVPAPRGQLGDDYFAREGQGGTTDDSGVVVRELTRENIPLAVERCVPTLLLAGERDPFCPPADVERLAHHVGATFRCVQGAGHAMPWEPGWEKRVGEIHRWLVQQLGDGLLASPDEEEQ